MARDFYETIQSIQTLRALPESERTEYYDSVASPLIERIAASVDAEHDTESLVQWLYVQSFTLGFAVEGITEVTYEIRQQFPRELEKAMASLPPEQQVRIQWLLREFEGQENLPAEIVEREARFTSNRVNLIARALNDTPRSITRILGEFAGTDTFQSSRHFPVIHGTFRIFALDGNELGSYVVNTGGGASNYRTTNGPVPPGTYRVSNHRPGRTTLGMVLEGVGYSFDVDPTDGTQVFGRSLFRIHPDGNPLGTNGCLGVRESADRLRECENHIANLLSESGSFKISINY
jgi:hypothetical protein